MFRNASIQGICAKQSGFSSPAMRYRALDGWRGICALMVAVLHFHTTGNIGSLPVVTNGHLYVDFFFLLSGFVLSHAYLDRLSSVRDVTFMIWRRLGRLWPLHLAILAAFVALEFAAPIAEWITSINRSGVAFDPDGPTPLAAIPSHIFLLHGLGIHDQLTWNIPSWSISVEFWTYFVFALVAMLSGRHTHLSAFVLVGIGSMIIAQMSPTFLAVENGLGFFRCLAGFFAGHLVYQLLRWTPAHLPIPHVIECIAVVGVFIFVSYAGGTPWELFAPVVFAATVWLFAQERGIVSRFFKSWPLQKLGLWSYSIYMVHALVIAVVHRASTMLEHVIGHQILSDVRMSSGVHQVLSFGNSLVMDGVTLLYVAAVVAISAITWRWIEMPAGQYWNGPFWLKAQALSLRIRTLVRAPANV